MVVGSFWSPSPRHLDGEGAGEMEVCWGGRGCGDRGGPGVWECVWALEGEAWNPGTLPSWDLLSTPPLHSAGVSSHQAPPTPTIATPGYTMALSKTLWVGVAMCRGSGCYARHWWPLAWHTWVDLEGCWAPRSGSWLQSRGLGLLPTPVLFLCILCPSVPGGALEGLCWVGCTEEGFSEGSRVGVGVLSFLFPAEGKPEALWAEGLWGLLPALVSLLPLGEVTGGIQAVPLGQLCLLLPASRRPQQGSSPPRCPIPLRGLSTLTPQSTEEWTRGNCSINFTHVLSLIPKCLKS